MNNPKQAIITFIILALPLFLIACGPAPAAAVPTLAPTQPLTPTDGPTEQANLTEPESDSSLETEDLTREDTQGNVIVVVTPVNLDQAQEALDFDVQMNTHSVDLSMDLAGLATLTTDTGKTVQPLKWDAPMGGHHVSGTLSFPASLDGTSLLDGATTLTLTIQGVDAPERKFTWSLPLK